MPDRADFRPERADFKPERADFKPKRVDFRPESAWGDKRMDGQTNKRKFPCALQDFVPFGTAAQKDQRMVSLIGRRKDGQTVEMAYKEHQLERRSVCQ